MVVVEKIIKCRLDINDVDEQFCPDYAKMRLEKTKKQLIGYCFRSMLITSVEEIILFSQIRTNSKELSGNMHMDIEARVQGIIYEPNEIIPDAKVNNITNTIISASSKFANINIIIGNVNILKIGDMTPVIVKLSQYNIYSTKISIAAKPFVPKISDTISLYLCDNDYKENGLTNKLKDLVKNYLNHIKELSPDKKKSLDYFSQLIYPYKKKRVWDKLQIDNVDTIINNMSILEYVPKRGNIIFKPECALNDDNIYIIASTDSLLNSIRIEDNTSKLSKINSIGKFNKQNTYKLVVCKSDGSDILNIHLEQYIKNLYTLIQFAETYSDKTLLSKSSHIWNYYNLNKK